MAFQLRPYQEDIVARCGVALRKHRACLLQLATGGGKTAVASEIFRRALAVGQASGQRRTFAFLAHRDDLLADTQARLQAAGIYAGRIQAGEGLDPLALVQVCSIQTLHARSTELGVTGIIVDEAHRAPAASIMSTLDRCPNAWILGLSATPERGDGASLSPPFDVMVRGPSTQQLTDMGFLSPCLTIAPSSVLKAPSMSLAKAVTKYHKGKTMVFCKNVITARDLAAYIGPKAICVDGETPMRDRRAMFDRYRDPNSGVDIITNCNVLTEGFDAPITDTIILGRNPQHAGSYLQIVGRGLRSFPGKEFATLVDLFGVSNKHGLPHDDRVFSLHGDPIKLAGEFEHTCPECGESNPPGAPVCSECGFEWPKPESMIHSEEEMELREAREAVQSLTPTGRTAIVGNTFPVKDLLQKLGGRWNPVGKFWHVDTVCAVEAQALVPAWSRYQLAARQGQRQYQQAQAAE